MVYNKILPIFSAATAGLMMASFATPVSALTYSSDVGVQFTFNSSLQVNVSADLIISNLSPGTDSDSNTIDVTILTNNATGYTLNATVGNNTTYNTRNLVHEVSGSSANFASINFGSSLSSLSTDNTWGYSYSTNNGSTWSNYDGLPLYSDATNIATLKTATGPASTNAGDKVNFKIAAKAATSQYSGEYNNVINFVATANPVPHLEPISCSGANKICYSPNSLGTVEGTMGEQSKDDSGNNLAGGSTVTLLASNFSQEGYGFAGWSDTYDYATNTNAHFYGPNETITIPADMSEGLALYAVWIQSAGSMQSDAASVCSGLTTAPTDGTANLASVSALTDARDDETYAIAKLADGKCWMIENLRLESTAAHNSDGALAQGYGTSATYGNFSGLADPESPWALDSTTANSLYSTDGADNTINIGTSSVGYRFPRYNNYNNQSSSVNRPQNPIANISTNSTTNAGMYSYGNYYTWHAAIADTTAYSSGDHNTTSICPTGWSIPLGNASTGNIEQGASDPANKVGGFSYLDRKMGGTGANQLATASSLRWRKYPANFVYSGVVFSGSVYDRGELGDYCSSTAASSGNVYDLYLTSSSVYPSTSNFEKYFGRTIRCITSS